MKRNPGFLPCPICNRLNQNLDLLGSHLLMAHDKVELAGLIVAAVRNPKLFIELLEKVP